MVAAALIADPARSNRSAGRAFAVSHATVGVVRRELERAGKIDRRPDRADVDRQAVAVNLVRARAGEPGAALKHGAYTMTGAMQVRADAIAAELRPLVPGATTGDEPAIVILSRVLARIEAISGWLDEHGLFRNRAGEPQPILKLLTSSENTALRLCDALGLTPTARARLGVARDGAAANAKYLEITSGNGDSSDA